MLLPFPYNLSLSLSTIYLTISLFIYLFIFLFLYLSVYRPITICLFCLSIYLSVYQSSCLSYPSFSLCAHSTPESLRARTNHNNRWRICHVPPPGPAVHLGVSPPLPSPTPPLSSEISSSLTPSPPSPFPLLRPPFSQFLP